MSLLGAFISGAAGGAQQHFEDVREDLQMRAKEAFQMRLIADERQYDQQIRQDEYAREDARNAILDQRYLDGQKQNQDNWNAEHDLRLKELNSNDAYRKAMAANSGSGGSDATLKAYNKAMDELDLKYASSEISKEQYQTGQALIGQRYLPMLGINVEMPSGVGDPLATQGEAEPAPTNPTAEERAAQEAEAAAAREAAAAEAEASGVSVRPSVGDQIGEKLAPMKGLLDKVKASTNDRFAQKEVEKLTGSRADQLTQGEQVQTAWNVVRYGENAFPPGSKERSIALNILRATGQEGVPAE